MITQQEYQARRTQLAEQLVEGSIAFIPAAAESRRNGDAHYRFRQDSDFYYLTGFNEPDALLVVSAGNPGYCILFSRPNNPAEEQWTGKRLGQKGAVEQLHMDLAFDINALADELPGLLVDKNSVYYSFGKNVLLVVH